MGRPKTFASGEQTAQHFWRWLPASYIARKLIINGSVPGCRETEYLFDLGLEKVMVVFEPVCAAALDFDPDEDEFVSYRFCVIHKDGTRNYPMEEIILPRRVDFELPDELPPLEKPKQPRQKRQASVSAYKRDQKVNRLAKLRAEGVCALCDQAAPFLTPEGEPYLETHHIVWLAEGGEDTPGNTVALCPNCHRRMHIVKDEVDVKTLLLIAGQL